MNAQRKKSAVMKYGDQKDLPKQELIDLLNSDEKNYTSDEVVEILQAIEEYKFENAGTQESKADKVKSVNAKFEEWKVKAIYEKQRGDDGTMSNVCVGFEKDAQAPIRVTYIAREKADLLNMQSANTLVRLYEAQ